MTMTDSQLDLAGMTKPELSALRADLVAQLMPLQGEVTELKSRGAWRELRQRTRDLNDLQARIAQVNAARQNAPSAEPGRDRARLSAGLNLSDHERLVASVGWAARQAPRLLGLLWDEHQALTRWLTADSDDEADQLQDALEACHANVQEALSETAGRMTFQVPE